MFMNYITREIGGKETLIAVSGKEEIAKIIHSSLESKFVNLHRIRTLNQLFDNEVFIPQEMEWIVLSDKKFHERQLEDRFKNLTDENALSPRPSSK
jgi:hypothetical protein